LQIQTCQPKSERQATVRKYPCDGHISISGRESARRRAASADGGANSGPLQSPSIDTARVRPVGGGYHNNDLFQVLKDYRYESARACARTEAIVDWSTAPTVAQEVASRPQCCPQYRFCRSGNSCNGPSGARPDPGVGAGVGSTSGFGEGIEKTFIRPCRGWLD
jgi:hypothetical protein